MSENTSDNSLEKEKVAKALCDHYVAGMEDLKKVVDAHIKAVYQNESALVKQFIRKVNIKGESDGSAKKESK